MALPQGAATSGVGVGNFALGFTTFPLRVLALALSARELLAQARDLAALLLDDGVAIVVR